MIVTIAGPPCSGKTTLAEALAEKLGPTCCVAPDVFAAWCAKNQRAPDTHQSWTLWEDQRRLNKALDRAGFDVLDAGSPWAIEAFTRARGVDPSGIVLDTDAWRVQHFYTAAILLAPLPWVSAPGRAEEPGLDREAMYDMMTDSIVSSGIPSRSWCRGEAPEWYVEQSLAFLRQLGVEVPA